MSTAHTPPTPPDRSDGLPPTWAKTACILCECNCGLEVLVEGRTLTKIRGDKDAPNSRGYTCEKPLRLDKYQNGPHRITSPMRRREDGSFEEISWTTALDEIAQQLQQVVHVYGGESVFFYGGGGQGNHLGGAYGRALFHAVGAKYMSNALAQEKTGEGWVDQQMYGSHTAGDFENAEVSVFVGKNPWQSHGVQRARPVLKDIARDPNRSMIVIDPRISETAAIADFHLQVRPGTDAWCVAALAATLVQEDLVDHEWLRQHTVGSDTVLAELGAINVTDFADRCGVPEATLRGAARRLGAAESVATYEDLGIQQAPNSTLVSYLQKMLWILTGSFATPGGVHIHSWMFPIAGRWHAVPPERRPRFNGARRALGLALMPQTASLLGRTVIAARRHRRAGVLIEWASQQAMSMFFRSVGPPIGQRIADTLSNASDDPKQATPVTGSRILSGLTPCNVIADEILTDHPQRLRALWIDASNPAHSLADSGKFVRAMRATELSVVIDVAMTETAHAAHYVLPASSQFEKHEASLFTLHFPHNTFQIRRPLMSPLPGTKSEPEIYAEVIDRLHVVDPTLLRSLTDAADIGMATFALTLFSSLERDTSLSGLLPYLLYRSLGTALGPDDQALALIWGLAALAVIAQPDAVSRAGFAGTGLAQANALFEALRDRHEGVVFTEDRYADAWKYIQHDDRKLHIRIPELLIELQALTTLPSTYTSEEFPFILSAGERRSFTANVIIRNPEWRRRDKHGALRISPGDARTLHLADGDHVRIVTETGSATTPIEISDMMQNGHISLPNGFGVSYPDKDGDTSVGVALNTLTTTTRRDHFSGSPWHKTVPARIEKLA